MKNPIYTEYVLYHYITACGVGGLPTASNSGDFSSNFLAIDTELMPSGDHYDATQLQRLQSSYTACLKSYLQCLNITNL